VRNKNQGKGKLIFSFWLISHPHIFNKSFNAYLFAIWSVFVIYFLTHTCRFGYPLRKTIFYLNSPKHNLLFEAAIRRKRKMQRSFICSTKFFDGVAVPWIISFFIIKTFTIMFCHTHIVSFWKLSSSWECRAGKFRRDLFLSQSTAHFVLQIWTNSRLLLQPFSVSQILGNIFGKPQVKFKSDPTLHSWIINNRGFFSHQLFCRLYYNHSSKVAVFISDLQRKIISHLEYYLCFYTKFHFYNQARVWFLLPPYCRFFSEISCFQPYQLI